MKPSPLSRSSSVIVDVFLFNDEEFHLQCRIKELIGVVDRFIAIEGNRTMSGKEKPYYLEGKEAKYRKYGVDFLKVDLSWLDGVPEQTGAWVQPGTQEHWKRDWKQRNAFTKLQATFPDDTVFIMGDVDEIPKRRAVQDFDGEASVLMMDHLIYSVNWASQDKWPGSVIGMKTQMKNFPRVRNARWGYKPVPHGGWHLGWFGGELAIEKKAKEFAHGEMAEHAKIISEQYPRQHIRPAGGVLVPYDGDLPIWVEEGDAPNSWSLDW
jgi:hypothetical protein